MRERERERERERFFDHSYINFVQQIYEREREGSTCGSLLLIVSMTNNCCTEFYKSKGPFGYN